MDGNTSDANFDYNSQGVCGSRSNERATWHRIIGSGKEVTVTVCSNNNVITDLGIFYNCNDQLCLGHPPQQDEVSDCAQDHFVEYIFFAEDGEDYHVHVRGAWLNGVGSQYTIKYTEPEGASTEEPKSPDEPESSSPNTTTRLLSLAFLFGAYNFYFGV